MSRVGKKPVAIPGGVTVAVADERRPGQGPEGRAAARRSWSAPRSTVEGGEVKVSAERDHAQPGVRHDARADPEHGDGRDARASARRSRSSAPATAPRWTARSWCCSSASRTRSCSTRPRASRSRSRTRRASSISGADKGAGGPGRRGHPRVPPAGAVQGQGRQVRRRVHPPQGRQGRGGCVMSG